MSVSLPARAASSPAPTPVRPFRPSAWPPALWALLALALLVRVPGISYGLPSLFYHHDEPQIVLRALRYGTGDFNPHAFRWPGTWHIDLMFVVYALIFLGGRALGVWHGPSDFAAQYFADPTVFYLSGRIVTLLLGLLTLPLLFALAERVASRRAAVWATALFALNWLHADLSRVTVPSVPMLFWITASLYLMSDPRPPGRGRPVLIGVCAGFASACLYYGGWVLLAWPGILAARGAGGRGAGHGRGRLGAGLRAALGVPFWLAALGAAVAFLASCPYALLDARTFVHDLLFVNAQYATWQSPVPRALLPLVNGYEVVALVMPELLGWPVWLLALAGGWLAWRRGSTWGRGVLVFVAAFGLLLVASRYLMPRYAMPWLPVACVFAGTALAAMRPNRARSWAAVAAAIALLWTAADVARVTLDKTQPDTRELAKAWVESHIPAGSPLVVDALHHRNSYTAPLDLSPQDVREKLARLRTEPSPYGSNEAYRLYYEYLLRHPGPRPYRQEWTEAGTRVRALEDYRRLGFRYAMVSSEVYDGFRAHGDSGGWQPNAAGRFYGGLEREAVLLAEFRGDRFLHPGPSIRIYSLSRNGASSNRGEAPASR